MDNNVSPPLSFETTTQILMLCGKLIWIFLSHFPLPVSPILYLRDISLFKTDYFLLFLSIILFCCFFLLNCHPPPPPYLSYIGFLHIYHMHSLCFLRKALFPLHSGGSLLIITALNFHSSNSPCYGIYCFFSSVSPFLVYFLLCFIFENCRWFSLQCKLFFLNSPKALFKFLIKLCTSSFSSLCLLIVFIK